MLTSSKTKVESEFIPLRLERQKVKNNGMVELNFNEIKGRNFKNTGLQIFWKKML